MHNQLIAALPPTRTFAESPASLVVNYGTDRDGWRALGPNGFGRELPAYMHDRMIALSFKAFRTNPLAKRLIEMQVNFVLGNGVVVNSTNAEMLTAIRRWWSDFYNEWPVAAPQRCRDLYIYGEWLHRPLTDTTGFTRIADQQPDKIAYIEPDLYSQRIADKVVLKAVRVLDQDAILKEQPVPVIRRRLEPKTWVPEKEYSGWMFYFGINRTTDSLRGVGELFPVLDYIDIHDDIVYSRAERVKTINQVYYDLQVTGMSEQEAQLWLKRNMNMPPKPGSVFMHSENMVLTPTSPKMDADDNAIDSSLIKRHITNTGGGWPSTWFDEAGTAGRAVGAEMAEPALRNIIMLQTVIAGMLSVEINYFLEQLAARGGIELPKDYQEQYTITFNKASVRDMSRIGPVLDRIGNFLKTAQRDLLLLSPEESRHMIVSLISQLGLSDMPLSMELPVDLKKKAEEAADLEMDAARADIAQKTVKLEMEKEIKESYNQILQSSTVFG